LITYYVYKKTNGMSVGANSNQRIKHLLLKFVEIVLHSKPTLQTYSSLPANSMPSTHSG